MIHDLNSTSTLGETIRLHRRIAALTQKDLGERCGVTQSAVARWETDQALPALRHHIALAKAINMPVAMLTHAEPAA